MKTIDTLVADIQGLFSGHIFDPSTLSRFSGTIESVLARRFAEYGEDRKPYLRLSNVGKPLRQLWYEIRSGLKGEPLSPSTKMKFLFGDLCESILIALAIEAGHDVQDLQRKVEVDGVPGSIDCIIDGTLTDIKSASTYSYKKFQSGALRSDDPFGYMAQLAGYSTALGDIDAAFFVIDKTLGNLCLDKYSKEELQEYDVRTRIRTVRDALASDVMPDCCCVPIADGKSGNMKLPVQGSYCAWKRVCYPELRTFAYSSGPVFLTNVALEPRVQEVI